MKKLTLLIILVSSMVKAQHETYWNIFIPLHTTHWSPFHSQGTPIGFHEGFLGSQGGQGGAIVSYNIIYDEPTVISTYTLGIAQNSFGDTIAVATKGVVYNIKPVRFGLETGFASGYDKSFKRESRRVDLKDSFYYTFADKYKVIPIVTATAAINITNRFGVKALINPSYINLGLNIIF